MNTYYLDTSALIKRYVTETGSNWMQALFRPEQVHFFITSRLTMPEVYSALARRLRDGSVSRASYETNIRAFQQDSTAVYHYLELTSDVVTISHRLLEKHPLRANDAVQLASALLANQALTSARLSPLTFLSADTRLNTVAASENLPYDNPNDHIY